MVELRKIAKFNGSDKEITMVSAPTAENTSNLSPGTHLTHGTKLSNKTVKSVFSSGSA